MNRFCYRVIFSKSLGRLVVVSEKAHSQGKSDSPSMGGSMPAASSPVGFGLKTLTLSLLLGLGMTAHATTVIADPSADKSLQPIVLPTASGITSVNIATPNDKGLSNNHYSQFDVGSTGLVLNNNRKAVNTQIAGFVAANPFMARGEASTILNQVNSNHPSHLGGFIEIAGKKADVIIANPSGLVVNGAGFINAGNVHLAAANSQVHQGQLTGYDVGVGNIAVNGKLNLQNTDYAALITKTAQINDEIYAGNTLDVILGENQISLQNGDFTKLNATNKQTSASSASQTTNKEQRGVALDISSLGGMYAGKIHLVGTDKGFGVNNAGVITATGKGVQVGTGTLTLDTQGNLVNTGVLSAKDKLAIDTHSNQVKNDGTLLSEKADLTINTKDLESAGTIHSTQTTQIDAANTLNNQGNLYGGVLQITTNTLTNTGKLIQTGTGGLNIGTDTLTNSNKAVIGQSLYEQTTLDAPSTPSSAQSAGTIGNDSKDNTTANTANSSNTGTPATKDTTQSIPVPSADGFITAKSLTNTNEQALITATGDISISANQTSNTNQASIDAQTLNTKTLTNIDSKIALGDINWQLTSFDNSQGSITARDGMVIDSGSGMINTGGQLSATDTMVLSAVGVFDNTQGVVVSGGGDAAISADGVNNHAGTIMSTGNISVTSKDKLTNDKGVISAQANTTLSVGTALSNHDGNIFGNQHLTIHSQDLTNSGQVYGGKSSTVTTSQTLSNSQTGLIASGGDATISAHTITHAGSIIAGMDREGKLGQPANLSIQSSGNLVSTGTHIATQAMVMTGNMLDLSDSHSEAVNINLNSQTDVNTTNATAIAADTLHISTPGQLNNTQGQLSAKQLVIDGSQLINHQGNINHSGTQTLTLSFNQGLDNSQGNISSNSQVLDIDTGTAALNNQQGSIAHTGSTLTVSTQHLGNHQGKLLSIGNQSLTVVTDINNSEGIIQADALAISAQSINNHQGKLLSTANQSLSTQDDINNHQGVIQASSFTIDAKALNNHQGSVFATDETSQSRIALTGNLSNTNGYSNVNANADTQTTTIATPTIATQGALAISANTLDNTGQISTKTLTVEAATINNAGSISSQEATSIHAKDSLNNHATGSLYAGADLTLNSQGHISHHGKALVGNRFSATAATLDLTGSHNEADSISYDSQGDITHRTATSLAAQNIRINNTQGVLSNQAGNLTAKTVDIHTGALQNGGVITAKELTISQTKDYTHTSDDILTADTLTFTTQGSFSNQHSFGATDSLTLTAASIHNHQDATITSSDTTLHSQTNITNQGLINGENTRITAKNTINNLAGGRIYGTHLAITADTLNNTPAKASDTDSHHTAPVIAARERLDIGVSTLNNNPNPDRAGKFNENFDSQALITSLGSLHIGGSLDDNHHATGKAQTVVNKGATIESAGQMQVDTKTLLNTNADFKKHTVKVDAESVYGQTLYRAHEQAAAIPTAQKSTDVADLGKKPMAGLFDCPEGSECIVNYDYDSTIWSYFKIDAPKQPIPDIKAKDLLDKPDLPKNETAESCALAEASNQACTQYNEALANYTKVMRPLLKWEEDNTAAIEALELAIREYNRQFATNKSDVDLALNIYTTDEAKLGPTSKKGAPDGALYVKDASGNFHFVTEEVDVITTDFVVYEDKTLASDPARMVAGQNLVIHGDTLINDKSQMNAGAGFSVIGDTVIQTPDNGLYGEKTKVTENGRFTRYTVRSSAGGRRHKRVPNGGGSFTQSFAPLATYGLPILNATINKTPSAITFDQSALTSGDVETVLAVLKANQSALSLDAKQQLSMLLAAKEQGQAVDEAILSELTKALSQSVNTKPASVISADFSQLTIPSSALYIINADDPNQPLVQTDPAFTDYKQWLGSDYMLKALQSDPNHIHKRLSDGYGEQARIKDEYYLLTGRHINTDYRSNEEAFKQLMDNGITHAKQFGYTLGTALTPDQMANLTTDIVWLVKQSITVATKDKDGNTITKTEEVLVPKLYLRSANIATGTLTPDGRYSAVSARNIDMQLTGDLDNNGNLIAKDTAAITANNVNNTGTIYGNFVAVTADNTIANHSTLHANSAMSLDAGNQIINQSLTTTQTNTQGRSSSSRTDISQIATISVGEGLKDSRDEQGKPLTTLSLRGNQIIYQGATSDNAGGSTQMTAKNGIDIGTVTVSNHISAVADDNNYFKYSQTTDVGSNISSYGNTIIRTTGEYADINIQGSSVQSEGVTAVKATGDVRMGEGRQTQSVESESLHTNRRLTGSKTERSSFGHYSDKSLISQVGGDQVVIHGTNTTLMATEVLADKDVLIKADNQLLIGSAKDNASGHSSHEVSKKGLFATSPTSVTLGKQQTRQNDAYEQVTYTGSLVGTTGGNIRLEAGDGVDVINSDIIAQKDAIDANTGNILFKAQAVDITSQNIQSSNESHFYQKTTGVTAGVSSSVVGDVQSIESLKDATENTDSRRAKLMGGLAAASKVRTLAKDLSGGNLGSIRAQATIGSQSTKSDSQSHQETNDAANIHADGNLIFDVSGKGADSTVTITGSNITAQENLYNRVEGDVIYQASTQTSTQDSQNSSKGWGAGVYASANLGTDGLSSNSAGFTANANRAKGSSQEIATTHTNTQVTVGGTTVNDIGGSLILDGANLDTTYLTGTVGGDLIVKSHQDEYQYTHDQKQMGGSLDVSFQGVPQSASINAGKTDIDASYKQVTHQSGIKAKESTLSVQGQGKFTGGYLITEAGKNQTQFAQGIQTQDIENHLSYEGDAISIGVGIGADTSSPDGKAKPALQGLGYGKIDPVNKTSTTYSAITDQAGLSHINTENFNQQEVQHELNEIITNDFDKEQVLKELNAQTIITTEFGREAPKAVAEFSQYQQDTILSQLQNIEHLSDEQINEILSEAAKWGEGGIYRVALHTAVGAIGSGTVEGALTTGGIAAAAPTINKLSERITEQLLKAGISEDAAQNATSLITSLAIATATQSAGVDTSSTAMAVNVDAFNRQLHKQEIDILKAEAKKLAQKRGMSENEAYGILYAWVYSQLDTKANNELSSYLSNMEQLQSPLTPYSTESYQKLIGHLQEADKVYQSLVKKYGSQKINTTKKDSQGNTVYLFKANTHQQNQANLFGQSAYYQGGIVGGDLEGSGTLNNQAQASYKTYFDGKIKSYQASKTSVSGEVHPVYPEDWIGGAALVGKGAVKLTGATLNKFARTASSKPVTATKVTADQKMAVENNFYRDDDFFTAISGDMKVAESHNWKKPDGSTWWPPHGGIVPGSSTKVTLPVGTKLDRYGGTTPNSSFLAPVNVSIDARALAPHTDLNIRDEYIVLKPLPVVQSKVMPWFGKSGMGIQYETKESVGLTIKELEAKGFIKKVN